LRAGFFWTSILLSPETNDAAAEADELCLLVARNFDVLREARLGSNFHLEGASFRLHSCARNTIYRVAQGFRWFLKLARSGDVAPFLRERLGAELISRSLGDNASYAGSRVIRNSTAPPFVLSSTIVGRPLNSVFFTGVWVPTAHAQAALEERFDTLGSLLGYLHSTIIVPVDAPDATTTPFRTLQRLLEHSDERDSITDTIASWLDTRRRSDAGDTFIHGNLRFDNVLQVGSRLAFVDFENCGKGSAYQDLSRPVSELLLSRCVFCFPDQRAVRCIRAFLRAYGRRLAHDDLLLRDFVTARVARYYLESRHQSVWRRRIGGIPVSARRLEAVTMRAVGGASDPLW